MIVDLQFKTKKEIIRRIEFALKKYKGIDSLKYDPDKLADEIIKYDKDFDKKKEKKCILKV